MSKQDPRTKPSPSSELDEAALAAITGGTDAAPTPPPTTGTQSNLLKKTSDTSSGIISNIK